MRESVSSIRNTVVVTSSSRASSGSQDQRIITDSKKLSSSYNSGGQDMSLVMDLMRSQDSGEGLESTSMKEQKLLASIDADNAVLAEVSCLHCVCG